MGKQSGLGAGLVVNGYLLSNDIGQINDIGGGPAALPVTGIDKSAFERIGGTRDGRMNLNAFFNKATGRAHPRFSLLPTGDVISLFLVGSTLGNPAAAIVSKQTNYDGSRGTDGSFTFDVSTLGNGYGLEWGKQLTAGARTDTSATNGTGVDYAGGGSLAFGAQFYLEVTAFTGTDCTIKVQESSDNAGDAYADVTGGAFTQVTGITAERIATSNTQTVERYLRVVTSGTFSSITFYVMGNRNETLTTF